MNTEKLKQPLIFLNTHKKPIIIASGVILFIIITLSASYYAYAKAYNGRIYPNVFIGVVDVGGLTQIDATEILNQHIDAMLNAGLDMSASDNTAHMNLRETVIGTPELSRDIIYFDSTDLIDIAMGVGRGDSIWRNAIAPVALALRPEVLQALPEIDENNIRTQIKNAFGELETPAISADYKITQTAGGFDIEFVQGVDGEELDINSLVSTIFDDAHYLELQPLVIDLRAVEYDMTEAHALSLSDEIVQTLEYAPYTLAYTSETLREYSWEITKEDLMDWLLPVYYYNDGSGIYPSYVYSEDCFPGLELNGDAYDEFIAGIKQDVNIDPVDARFVTENGVVTEFRGSQNGIEFDENTTISELMDLLGTKDVNLEITVASTPPDIAIEDVNGFGIKEIIGVGTSNFSGSPSNRMVNIAHGSEKLNGLLVAPGETISLIEHLRPFTLEDGYLPEMVILGDEIKPEIGGGLCQIGTTAFRAVMNSGMQVDERRNHSLVVSYYNDPSNGNPGTDATLYDPHPDLAFTNTYENYVLLTTQVDIPSRSMTFTFWGTDDGRHGYYTPPSVLSWVPYGETEYKETLDLEPGVEKCQSAHAGATTQFTYFIDYLDGTQYSEVITSVYRPLQKICLVGVEELTVECQEGEVCEEVQEDSEEETDTTEEAQIPEAE